MNDQLGQNIIKILKIAFFVLLILAGIFIAFKLAFFLAPFILAFAISSLIEPIVRFLMKKAKLSRKLASTITLILVLATFGTVLTLVIIKLISEIGSIYNMLPTYFSDFYNNIKGILDKGTAIYINLPQEITKSIEGAISNLSDSLMKLLSSIFKSILNTAISIPQIIIFVLVTILSTYFFTSDRHKIYNYVNSQLPKSWINKLLSIKSDMFSALFGYIKAQLILMTITFTELSIGFSIINLKHSLLIAFIISIVDALPILGTGGILMPWAAYSLLIGNYKMALSLLIIYAIVLVVRQMIEPKILGEQIGVNPLVTLIAMYSGLQLFGVIGLILGPITVLLLKNIFSGMSKSGLIKDMFK